MSYFIPLKNTYRYASVAKLGQEFSPKKIAAHIPTPQDVDYQRGYIVRYFIQKANDKDSKIFEVDEYGFAKFINSPFYIAVEIDWRLAGPTDEIRQSNMKSINFVKKQMPALKMYLVNYLQFSKNNLELL
jgi:hypothetical protein